MASPETAGRRPALGHWVAALGYLVGAAVLLRVPMEFRWFPKRGGGGAKKSESVTSGSVKRKSPTTQGSRSPTASSGARQTSPLRPTTDATPPDDTTVEAPSLTTVTPMMPKGDLTPKQLLAYDGADGSKPVLLAARGVIYDVTAGSDFYGAGGSYNVFSGKDCSRALAKMSLSLSDVSSAVDDLTEDEKKTLDDWIQKFQGKYPVVGNVKHGGEDVPL